jgi:hypothetical protein
MLRSLAVKRDIYFRLCYFNLLLNLKLKVFKHLINPQSNSITIFKQSIFSLHISNLKCFSQANNGYFSVLDIVYNYLFYKGINKLLLTKRDNTFIASIYKP